MIDSTRRGRRYVRHLFLLVVGMLVVTPALAIDAIPPAEVSGLRLSKSGIDAALTWTAVTTNLVGAPETVTTYRIYRATVANFVPDRVGGSNRIGTASGIVFNDPGALTAPSRYFYLVTAVDVDGNEGNAGPSKVVVPPSLAGTFTASGANLSWSGAAPLGNVAGYVVYWGTAGNLSNRVDVGNVTSTAISPLSSGVTYFFRVVAYDSAANVSAPSNQVSGQILSNGPTEVCGRIATSTTWTVAGSPYIVTCDVDVWANTSPFPFSAPPPAILTIEPGVVVKFNAGTGLNIANGANGGGLNAAGSASSPIVFQANLTFPPAGYWKGLTFADGTEDAATVLQHVSVESGGMASGAALTLNSAQFVIRDSSITDSLGHGIWLAGGSPADIENVNIDRVTGNGVRVESASPTIRGSTIRSIANNGVLFTGPSSSLVQNNSIQGLTFDTATGDPSISGNTFSSYDTHPARIGADDVREFLNANVVQGATPASRLEIVGETLTSDVTWPNPGYPLVVVSGELVVAKDQATAVTLTLTAGTTMKFAFYTRLLVGFGLNKGALVAVGTVAQPITFTTNDPSPAPGQWGGIQFDDGSVDATSVLDHCVVEYAGQYSVDVRLVAASPTIRNSTIRNSSYYGVYGTPTSSPTIQGNSFSGNANFDVYISGESNASVTGNTFANVVYFDTATGTHAVTGNTFNGYNDATRSVRIGAHAVAGIVSNTFSGTGTNSLIEVLGETLAFNATWSSPGFPYSLFNSTVVAKDPTTAATLTINPGVTLRFNYYASLSVGTTVNRGALIAMGTTLQPIVFSSNTVPAAPGQWQGIYFDDLSDDATSVLDHCIVEYAGQSSANVRLAASSPRIQNSTIRNSSYYGVYGTTPSSPLIQGNTFSGNANFDVLITGESNSSITGNTFANAIYFDTATGTHAVTGNTFNGYDDSTRSVRIGAHAVPGIVSNTFNGTGTNSFVEVLGETLAVNATWSTPGFPYSVLGNIVVAKDPTTPATLTINPGVTMQFSSGAGLFVGTTVNRGSLVAVGTNPQPILFTSSTVPAAPGQWQGIYFDDKSDDATSVLDHCIVEYAGQYSTANVRLAGSSPRIQSATIRNSGYYGVYGASLASPTIQGNNFSGNANFDVFISGESNASVTGNTFANAVYFDTATGTHAVTGNTFNAYNDATRSVRVGAHAVPGIASNTFNGTGANSLIEVLGETLSANATWSSPGFPLAILGNIVVARDPATAATLTINPGVTLRFNSGVGLFVGTTVNRGALIAVGTTPQPIVFTSNTVPAAPGQWQGIYFDDLSDDTTSRLDHCVVEYAGQSYAANVRVAGSSPRIQNSTIRNSSYYGVYGAAPSSPTIQGNNFSGNADLDVLISGESNASLSGNTFSHAVRFDSASGTPTVSNNVFHDYIAPYLLRVGADSLSSLDGNTFDGTDATSKIEVLGETLSGSHLWQKLTVPYAIVSGDVTVSGTYTVAATLRLNPGVTIRFASSTHLLVATPYTQGELIAIGTAAQKITFTSDSPSPAAGDWGGLYFENGTTFDTVLEHSVIEYAGQFGYPAVTITRTDLPIRHVVVRDAGGHGILSQDSSPQLSDVQISNTGGNGIRFVGGAQELAPVVTNCTITNPVGYGIYNSGWLSTSITNSTIDNSIFFDSAAGRPIVQNDVLKNYDAFPLHIGADSISSLTGNVFNNTGPSSRIEVIGETLNADHAWSNPGLPYRVVTTSVTVAKTVEAAATLTIQPGVTIQFDPSIGIDIANGSAQGALVAVGTQAQPILFTTSNTTPAPGQWRGITFSDGTVDSASVMENCTVEYGGQVTGADIYFANSSPTIRNCAVRQSEGSGLVAASSAPTIQFNNISNNQSYGIVVGYGSYPRIHHNNLTGNSLGAINNAWSEFADARFNWYGDASGPSDAGPGSGQPVGANVVFDPWLAAPFSTANYFDDMFESTPTFAPGSYTRYTGSVTQPSNWSLKILGPANQLVRTITGAGTAISVDWNGRDGGGADQPNGAYRYRFEATATGTSAVATPLVGRVSLDGTFVAGALSSPSHAQVFSVGTQVPVIGTAAGSGFANYALQYGSTLFPSSYSTINSSPTPVPNGQLGSWNTTGLGQGVYSLRLLVNNNQSEQTIVDVGTYVLTVNSLDLDHPFFSPNGDGRTDEVTASAALSVAATWTLSVVNTGTSAIVRTWNGNGAAVRQAWDGKQTNGTPAPEGVYRFDLTATKNGAMVASSSATTVLDLTPPIAAITAPAEDSAVVNVIAFTGTADDANGYFQNYQLEFGVGRSPLSYQAIAPFRTTPVISATLGTWETHGVVNGGYLVRLTVTDRAGNVAQAFRFLQTDNLVIGAVSTSRTTLDRNGGDTAQISFSINKPATVTLKIFPEAPGDAGPVQRTMTGSFAPGAHSFVWDGSGDGGTVLSDEAYIYVLEADAGSGRTDRYSPTGGRGYGAVGGTVDYAYNPYTNDSWRMSLFLLAPERVCMTVYPPVGATFTPVCDEPHEAGNFDFAWDGRDASGQIVTTPTSMFFNAPFMLRPNYIILTGNTPKPSGLTSDPYRIVMSYAAVSRLSFHLDHDAQVTITILPPGIADPAAPSGQRIMTNQLLAAGDHEVQFDPIDPSDTNEDRFRFGDEGAFTFAIEAVNPTTGATSLRRGVLNMYR